MTKENPSPLILGCMRLAKMTQKELEAWIEAALEQGIHTFDHADIYGQGICEEKFGQILKASPNLRNSVILQSKCGIRDGFYDLSGDYVVKSVDGILKRLNTDYLDVLLLHRPDALADAEDLGRALETLQDSGKVRHFGVSNMNAMQIGWFQSNTRVFLEINQLQLSLAHTPMLDNGLYANMYVSEAADRTGSVLEYCRMNKISVQAWSILQYGIFEGTFLENPGYEALNTALEALAEKYRISKMGVAIAWILRHPANIRPILGSTKIQRIQEASKAAKVMLTKEEWYKLYCAAGHTLA